MARQSAWLAVGMMICAIAIGCGGKGSIKAETDVVNVIDRLEQALTSLQGKLGEPSYTHQMDGAFSISRSLIKDKLPYMIANATNEKARQAGTAKVEELQQVFQEQVFDLLAGPSRDLGKAADGVGQCLSVVSELRKAVGG